MNRASVAVNLLWCVPGVGGSEEYLVRQLVGLSHISHDYDIQVFAPRGFSARQPYIAENFVVHEAPSECLRRAERIAIEHTWLAFRTRHFDIVHHGGGSIPRLGNRSTVLTIHDVQWVEYPEYVSSTKLRYLRHMVPSSLRRATRIAVPSHFVLRSLVTGFNVDPSRIGVVRHGLEEAFEQESTSADSLRKKFSLGQGPVLVYPAITHPHKNHRFLLELMTSDTGRWADPSLRLVCAGSAGSIDKEVRDSIIAFGLSSRVVMAGRVSTADRNGLLALAQALVFPSQYEGFGAPVIEAMRCGSPVICSNKGSLPEIVGDAGLVCALETDAWINVLEAVHQRREELVEAGRERAREFTTEISATELLAEYDMVLRKAR